MFAQLENAKGARIAPQAMHGHPAGRGAQAAIGSEPGPQGRPHAAPRYHWRIARDARDLRSALKLRARMFRARSDPEADFEALDLRCTHVLIETESGTPVGCCRMQQMPDGSALGSSCSARSYDLTRLRRYRAPIIELGRVCLAPDHAGPDPLRLMFGAILSMARDAGATLMIGCSSFAGTDPQRHGAALAHLHRHHRAPERWRPGPGGRESFALAELRPPAAADARPALPPLLRAYLAHGGWCGPYGVIDRDLGTVHVFTALELRRIPPARWRFLQKSILPPHPRAPASSASHHPQ